MANWQMAYLKKEQTFSSDAGVIYVDLPSDEQISMLMLEFSCYNTGPTSRLFSRTILDVVKDIHVLLEGSKSAYHAKPEVGSFMAWLIAKQLPPHNIRERGETTLRLPIYFGRFPGDEVYMLNTKDYANAQLQIEYELNPTYETSGTAKLTAWLVRPVEKLTPRGFIRSRIVNSYTSSGSAETKEVDLPTGLPWLNVGFRCFDLDRWLGGNITDIDFDVDEGRLHVFDGRMEDLVTLQRLWYQDPILGHRLWAMCKSGQELQTFLGEVDEIIWTNLSAQAPIFNSSSIWGPSYTIGMRADDGVASATELDVGSQPIGGCPYSGLVVGNFAEDPFDAPSHADAKIEFEILAHAALIETWVQEIVTGKL